jgi:hypothetical protein
MLAAAVVLWLTGAAAGRAGPNAADGVWFAPDPGTLDYLRLFDHPEEWPRARSLVRVFKFYQQHTRTPAPSIVGPNTYDALLAVDAFRQLQRWHIKTAIEVGAVKEFYCTADPSGMEAAIRDSIDSMDAVLRAGGSVQYLAMDEPWVSGRSRKCGGPALEPTADRVAIYVNGVHRVYPDVRIGLIEAYPFSSADAIQTVLQLLEARNVPPAFLHMDVDWHRLGEGQFAADMLRLQRACAAQNIPFGIIVVGYNGDADALYAKDAGGIVDLIADTFQTWAAMPDQIIFQSWVVSSTGVLITPTNLPEGQLDTHTNLVWQLTRRLRGTIGGPIGPAIPRPGT